MNFSNRFFGILIAYCGLLSRYLQNWATQTKANVCFDIGVNCPFEHLQRKPVLEAIEAIEPEKKDKELNSDVTLDLELRGEML